MGEAQNILENELCGEHQRSVRTSRKRCDPSSGVNGETWQIGLRFQQFSRPVNQVWLYFLLIKNLQSIRAPANLMGATVPPNLESNVRARILLDRLCSDYEGLYQIFRGQSSIGKTLQTPSKLASLRAGIGRIMLLIAWSG